MLKTFFLELLILFILTLFQGFFSGSEIALISLRKSRVKELQKKSPHRARIIKQLQANPEQFIATAQIGITVMTIIASAFAGTNFEHILEPVVAGLWGGMFSAHAGIISFIIIIGLVAYLALVLGELLPKSLALSYPEKFALAAAYPIYGISKISAVLIKFLVGSTNLLLKPFRNSTSFSESRLSEEELRTLLQEGQRAGTIPFREHELLENVFEFGDTTADKIMTPVSRITALDSDDDLETNLAKAVESEYTRIPVFQGTINNIIGILNIKDLLPYMGKSIKELDLRKLLTPPIYVPYSQKISTILQKFQRNKIHIALVTDEHGAVEGLVTLEDVIEEIVGEITDESDDVAALIVKQKDGSYLVEGAAPIVDFNRYFKTSIPEDDQFTTISGFILDTLERFPEERDVIIYQGLEFRVLEKTDRAINTVQVKETAVEEPGDRPLAKIISKKE